MQLVGMGYPKRRVGWRVLLAKGGVMEEILKRESRLTDASVSGRNLFGDKNIRASDYGARCCLAQVAGTHSMHLAVDPARIRMGKEGAALL